MTQPRARAGLVVALVLTLAATACTPDGDRTPAPRDDTPRGGALKVTFGQFANLPALERIALRPGS